MGGGIVDAVSAASVGRVGKVQAHGISWVIVHWRDQQVVQSGTIGFTEQSGNVAGNRGYSIRDRPCNLLSEASQQILPTWVHHQSGVNLHDGNWGRGVIGTNLVILTKLHPGPIRQLEQSGRIWNCVQ